MAVNRITIESMKKILIPILIAFLPIIACTEQEEKSKEVSVTGAATDITEFKAKLSGYANLTPNLGNVYMGILYSTEENPTLANSVVLSSKELDGNNMYSVLAVELSPNTVYYYKSFVHYGDEYRFGAVKSFMTRDFAVSFKVSSATDITATTATLNGLLEVESIEELNTSAWFYYGTISGSERLKQKGVRISAHEEDGIILCNLTGLIPETTYNYIVGAKVHNKEYYGEVKSFSTKKLELEEVADLGLSVKWRGWNLGANAPEEYGDKYAWGETEIKTKYEANTYLWGKSLYGTLYKYNVNTKYGNIDNRVVLKADDDVAQVKLGDGWRMPTKEEFKELYQYCNHSWISLNGVNGTLFTARNGNSVFFPAGGASIIGMTTAGLYGYYWSSSLFLDDSWEAYYMFFDSTRCVPDDVYHRYLGFSVRPVLK